MIAQEDLKVGAEVVGVCWHAKGCRGTIVYIDSHDEQSILVRFPGTDGHDGSGFGPKQPTDDHWWCDPCDIELYQKP